MRSCVACGASPFGATHRCSPVFMSMAVMRPTGPFQMGSPSRVNASMLPRTVVATAAKSVWVVPDCGSSSRGESTPGMTCSRKQPLCELTNRTPVTGSPTAGPVMLVPPPPPGQFHAGPAGSSVCVGGSNRLLKRLFSSATWRAISLISGV